MKLRFYALVLLCLTFFIFSLGFVAFANEKGEEPEPVVIKTYEEDITGDGLKETIKLKGVLLSEDSDYFHKVWANIKGKYNQQWKIHFESGYKPTILFNDLTHNKMNDMLYQSASKDNNEQYNYQLYTLKNEKATEIPLPEQDYIQGKFKDNFKVDIRISHDADSEIVNIKNQASKYVQLGIYNEQGELQKPTSAVINPISFIEPKLISKSKGMGMKSFQQINATKNTDQLGTIETLWYYEKGDWIILKTKWVRED